MGRPRKWVTVVWNDAHSTLDELSIDELRGRHRPNVIHTTGYVLISDDVGITIAGEWLPPEGGGDETFRNSTFIPRGMVVLEGTYGRKRKVPTKEVQPNPPPVLDVTEESGR